MWSWFGKTEQQIDWIPLGAYGDGEEEAIGHA